MPLRALIVSSALDTNGQNARYGVAAERWGSDPAVLKALIVGLYDPADVAGRYREAAAKSDGLSIRTAHRSEAYFEFPHDIRWRQGTHEEVQQLANECDVVHLNNSEVAYRRLSLGKLRKPALLHHHGTLFRDNPAPLLAIAKRFHMVQAVSTVDLMRPAPDLLHWLPTAYDLDALAKIRAEHRREPDGMVRVLSAPTRPDLKSTDALRAAVATLQAEGLPVELEVITKRPWRESLEAKARADIYFDQVAVPKLDYPGGYGCNAIEAWGMGLPVVAGADEWTLDKMAEVFDGSEDYGLGGPIPFYVATEDTIADRLRELVEDAELRKSVALAGQRHAQRFHAEKPALVRLAELYGMAIAKMRAAPAFDAEEFPLGPGTFRTALARLRVRVSNQEYSFVNGMVTIDNPHMAQRMRRLAHYQRQHQITEEVA